MLERILNAVLPGESASPRSRRVWTGALLLFPLALAAGFVLLMRNAPPSPVPVTIDGRRAIAIARAFAVREGVPAAYWRASLNFNSQDTLLKFVNARPENKRLWSIAPPVYGTVKLKALSGDQSATVNLSVDGNIIGFEWKNTPVSGRAGDDAESLRLAMARLPAGFQFGEPSIEKKGLTTTYAFHSSAVQGAELEAIVKVEGNRVTWYRVNADVNAAGQQETQDRLQTGLTLAGTLFIAMVALFSIYRYASRTMQQEISHRRSLVVALFCGCFCVLLGGNAVLNGSIDSVSFALIVLVFAIMGLLGGALLAAAYGSGEGDIREAWPGKLTSLDALLSGRVFSRNVGVSILVGIACASWLILALGVVTSPFRVIQAQGSTLMTEPFLKLAWLLPFVTYPLMSLAFAAAGLLQPLAFLQRFVPRARRWHLPVLLVSSGLVSTMRVHTRYDMDFVATSAVFAAALLVPFFLLDLLGSLVCVTIIFTVTTVAVSVVAIPSRAAWSIAEYATLCSAAVLFALVCVRRGRNFSEEQVRPLYARHIAERKAMEAEVSAAREAQLRLLPECVPEFAGLDIAAACLPAETVGGDFYDFFPLGDGRLGVFLAEGNNRGLAAALTIALAKGYLMHCVERFRDPVEILTRLETALASIFERQDGPDSALTDFAFAAIDTVKGEVRYARTGVYPKVVVVSAKKPAATERLAPVRGRLSPIAEGWAPLGPGDRIVLFTDGIGRRLAGANKTPEDVACALASRETGDMEGLRKRILAASKGAIEPDDLTVVVIERLARVRQELEVVA